MISDSFRRQVLPPEQLDFGSSGLYSYFKDSQGLFWVCTSAGLYKITIQPLRFKKYFTQSALGLQVNNQARSIATDSTGNVYAALWNRVYKETVGGSVSKSVEMESIVYGLRRVGSNIYAGGLSLNIFNTGLGHPIASIAAPSQLSDISVIEPINKNDLLLGSMKTIAFYESNTGKFQPVDIPKSMPPLFWVYRFLKINNQYYWAISQNGIYTLDVQARKLVSYFFADNTDSLKSFPFDDLHDAYADGNGHIWLATNGDGLYKWDTARHTIASFNSTSGLPSNVVYRIEPDDFGGLWISTDNGLARLRLRDNYINYYTTKQGITHNEFNRLSSYKAPDGKLYFGGLNGIIGFDPREFAGDTIPANETMQVISLSQFSAAADSLIDKTLNLLLTNTIRLEAGDRFFTLEFKLLDYNDGKINYAYRVDGIDQDWNMLPNNILRMSGLPVGNYTLYVRGQDTGGQWSGKMLAIPLVVKAYLWQKTWFIMLMILLLGLAVFAFFKWRIHRLRQSKMALERTVDKRTQQLRESLEQKDLMMKEIHHRVKNNLQVISSLLNLQLSRTADPATQDALTESKNRVLSIAFIHQNLYQHEDLKGVEMKSFVRDLCSHMQGVFEKLGQHVSIEKKIDELFLDIDTAVPLGLITNELLTNSFKYAFENGKPGKIIIQLSATSPGNYLFRYHDNGIGLPENFDLGQSESLGMRLIGRLAEQLAGNMRYRYENGSLFVLHFRDFEERKKIE
jgi:two-component sensor histidine kinase